MGNGLTTLVVRKHSKGRPEHGTKKTFAALPSAAIVFSGAFVSMHFSKDYKGAVVTSGVFLYTKDPDQTCV